MLDNWNKNGLDGESDALTNISLNCTGKITRELTQGPFSLTEAFKRLELLGFIF